MATPVFKEFVVDDHTILLFGTMDKSQHIVELYRNIKLKWFLIARSASENEVCIIASGPQIFSADYFIEKHLP